MGTLALNKNFKEGFKSLKLFYGEFNKVWSKMGYGMDTFHNEDYKEI